MANRFSRGPRQYVNFEPRSIEELSIAPAMRQQRHDMNVQTMAQAQGALSELQVRSEDEPYKQKRIKELEDRFSDIRKRGPLDRQTDDIVGLINNVRKDPFWNQATQLFQQSEEARQIEAKMAAEGRPVYDLGNARGTALFDEESGTYRNDLAYNVKGYEKTYDPFQREFMQDIKPSSLGSNYKELLGNLDPDVPFLEYMSYEGISQNMINKLKPGIYESYLNTGKGQEQLDVLKRQYAGHTGVDYNSEEADAHAREQVGREISSKLDNMVHTKSSPKLQNNPEYIPAKDREKPTTPGRYNQLPNSSKVSNMTSDELALVSHNTNLPQLLEIVEQKEGKKFTDKLRKIVEFDSNITSEGLKQDLYKIGKGDFVDKGFLGGRKDRMGWEYKMEVDETTLNSVVNFATLSALLDNDGIDPHSGDGKIISNFHPDYKFKPGMRYKPKMKEDRNYYAFDPTKKEDFELLVKSSLTNNGVDVHSLDQEYFDEYFDRYKEALKYREHIRKNFREGNKIIQKTENILQNHEGTITVGHELEPEEFDSTARTNATKRIGALLQSLNFSVGSELVSSVNGRPDNVEGSNFLEALENNNLDQSKLQDVKFINTGDIQLYYKYGTGADEIENVTLSANNNPDGIEIFRLGLKTFAGKDKALQARADEIGMNMKTTYNSKQPNYLPEALVTSESAPNLGKVTESQGTLGITFIPQGESSMQKLKYNTFSKDDITKYQNDLETVLNVLKEDRPIEGGSKEHKALQRAIDVYDSNPMLGFVAYKNAIHDGKLPIGVNQPFKFTNAVELDATLEGYRITMDKYREALTNN